MAAFIGQGPPMRQFDQHVKQPITVRFVSFCLSRFGAWKCHHNDKPVCETLRCILKILWRKLEIFHILLKIQFSICPEKRLPCLHLKYTMFSVIAMLCACFLMSSLLLSCVVCISLLVLNSSTHVLSSLAGGGQHCLLH